MGEWVGGVGQMIMFYAKMGWFTNEVWLQTEWVGSKKVKILITDYMNGPLVQIEFFQKFGVPFLLKEKCSIK